MTHHTQDLPLQDAADMAQQVIARGGSVYQKFTCHHCGARQTMEDENVFYMTGRCEECGRVSEIKKCGFLAIFGHVVSAQ